MKKIFSLLLLITISVTAQNKITPKQFGIGVSRFSTTSQNGTVNGSIWYDGGLGGLNGFNLYSNDPSNASFLLSVGNSTNYLRYYADHGNNNWLAVRPGSSMMFSTDGASSVSYEIDQYNHVWTIHTATTTGAGTAAYRWNSANHTGQTASTEFNPFIYGLFGIQYNTGALARQRGFNIGQMTASFVGSSTITDAANFYIAGGIVAGTNALITNNSALMIGGMTGTSSIGAGTTNGYGITIYAPTGATNNYCARFLQGNVGFGVSTPSALVHLGAGTTAANSAPLKFTSGPLQTTAEAGALEFLTDQPSIVITTGTSRKNFVLGDIALTSGRVPFSTTNGRLTDLAAFTYVTNRLSPTYITLAASTTAAGTAPVKLTTGPVMTTPEIGSFEYTTPQLFFTNSGVIRQEIPLIQQSRVATSFSATANTTLANITGLTANCAAGKTYKITANIYTTSAATGGVKFAVGGTATATSIIYEGLTTNGGLITQSRGAAMATTVGAVTAVTAAYVTIEGLIVVNAAGTITIQFAQNVSDATSSVVLAGSNFRIQEML